MIDYLKMFEVREKTSEFDDCVRWGMMAPFGRVAEVKLLRKTGATSCGFATWFAERRNGQV